MGEYKTWGRSRSTRLRYFDYAAPNVAYHVIIGAQDRRAIFSDELTNKRITGLLSRSAQMHGYSVLAYCLMPDHLHILIQSGKWPHDLRQFIRGFKSSVTRATGRRLWQRGFFEHVLRKEENILAVAEYILNNPVRKGLVSVIVRPH
jgi:putative transposase